MEEASWTPDNKLGPWALLGPITPYYALLGPCADDPIWDPFILGPSSHFQPGWKRGSVQSGRSRKALHSSQHTIEWLAAGIGEDSLKNGQLVKGPKGPNGPKGAKGPNGPKGPKGPKNPWGPFGALGALEAHSGPFGSPWALRPLWALGPLWGPLGPGAPLGFFGPWGRSGPWTTHWGRDHVADCCPRLNAEMRDATS